MKFFSCKQAAKYISKITGKVMSVRQLQHEIKTCKIFAIKVGNTYIINKEDLLNYQRRRPGPKKKT